MWEKILTEQAVLNGFFALLFVSLFIYVLNTTREREKGYRELCNRMSAYLPKTYDGVESLCEGIKEINTKIDKQSIVLAKIEAKGGKQQ